VHALLYQLVQVVLAPVWRGAEIGVRWYAGLFSCRCARRAPRCEPVRTWRIDGCVRGDARSLVEIGMLDIISVLITGCDKR
jgi:hypothetical protein